MHVAFIASAQLSHPSKDGCLAQARVLPACRMSICTCKHWAVGIAAMAPPSAEEKHKLKGGRPALMLLRHCCARQGQEPSHLRYRRREPPPQLSPLPLAPLALWGRRHSVRRADASIQTWAMAAGAMTSRSRPARVDARLALGHLWPMAKC